MPDDAAGLLFVDTSGCYDLLFPRAPRHVEILELMRGADMRFVTTTHVLDELVALLLARCDHATAARAGSHIRAAAEVMRVEHPDAAREDFATLP